MSRFMPASSFRNISLAAIAVWALAMPPDSLSQQQKEPLKPAPKLDLPEIEPANFGKIFPPPPQDLKFPPITDFKATLEKVSPEVEFTAGSAPSITFRLQNKARKSLVIYEWMMKESFNISIYHIPWNLGDEIPPIDNWTESKPEPGQNPRRMTLELKPNNSAPITTSLDFIKGMKIITPQDFLIIARLNLSSFPLQSRMVRIRVNP